MCRQPNTPLSRAYGPSHGRFHRCAKRLKGYVRGELSECREVTGHTSGRTLSGKVRPECVDDVLTYRLDGGD